MQNSMDVCFEDFGTLGKEKRIIREIMNIYIIQVFETNR